MSHVLFIIVCVDNRSSRAQRDPNWAARDITSALLPVNTFKAANGVPSTPVRGALYLGWYTAFRAMHPVSACGRSLCAVTWLIIIFFFVRLKCHLFYIISV